jgi:hypothetical protein
MGLDMYLTAKRYLFKVRAGDKAIAEAIGKLDLNHNGMRVKEIACEAIYWRKANAIHNWFVQNVQSGVDDCREYYVTRSQLQNLLSLCQKVLAEPSKSEELLPPMPGFFFGSAEVNEWYWDDLKSTIGGLNDILADSVSQEWEFYYASSW